MAQAPPSSLFEEVSYLHFQIQQNPKPEKLAQYLESLLDLPITLDIVERTGVGSTVHSLRKYEQVAILAARLMTQWMKLPPAVETAAEAPKPELSESRDLPHQASVDPQQVSRHYVKPQDKKPDQPGPPKKPQRKLIDLLREQELSSSNEEFGKPKVKRANRRHHRNRHQSNEKKKSQVSDKGKGNSLKWRRENFLKVASRAEGSYPSFTISPKEKQPVASASKGEKKPDSSSDQKKSRPSSQLAPGKSIKKPKDKAEPPTGVEKSKLSVASLQGQTQKGELTLKVKDQECSNKLQRQGKRVAVLNADTSPSKIQKTQELEEDDDFERHSMSFESYLLYDQPPYGRVVKSQTLGGRKKVHPKLKTLQTETKRQSAVKDPPKENSGQPEKPQLFRIEKYNPMFLEDSDNLWKVHCLQYFRKEQPAEFESWRELYFRLHDAQEERLYSVTNAIRLAQAQKPQSRQAKLAFISSTSKSPHDVLGKQMLQVRLPHPNAHIKAIQQPSNSSIPLASGDSRALMEPTDGPSTSGPHSAQAGSRAHSNHSQKIPRERIDSVRTQAARASRKKSAQS
ncbi:elongin-A-like [Sarcophilus harrisii]|uniref:elongin-A-like n=1 Tax=Sarcophilus harrisii TaxID=9305 RepID=UPI0013020275|nr:elongin-A-like [Sarcophilus harrisii]